MKIITQDYDDPIKGYHGTVGTPTNMYDSFGKPLFVGDVVLMINQDEFSKKNHYVGTEYGLTYVIEENTEIVNYTNHSHQFVMGLASLWDSDNYETLPTDEWFSEDSDIAYWDDLLHRMSGWIVYKMKSYEDLVEYEKYEFLHMQTIEEKKEEE